MEYKQPRQTSREPYWACFLQTPSLSPWSASHIVQTSINLKSLENVTLTSIVPRLNKRLQSRQRNKRIHQLSQALSNTYLDHSILMGYNANLSHETSTKRTCARWNRTTGPPGPPRFEALTHHQAGSCTQKGSSMTSGDHNPCCVKSM